MALTALSATIRLQTNWTVEKSTSGMSNTPHTQSIAKSIAFTTGVGANQCNQLYAATRTLAAGATENLDLAGSLTDLVGQTSIAFARVKAIQVRLLSASETAADGTTVGTACSSITIGGAASAQAALFFADVSDKHKIYNGGFYAAACGTAAGVTVTATTADLLKVNNDDGAVAAVYEIVLIGAET